MKQTTFPSEERRLCGVQFKKMLDKGNPPDDWEALLEAAKAPTMTARFDKERAHKPDEP